jgi:hypothetical protein
VPESEGNQVTPTGSPRREFVEKLLELGAPLVPTSASGTQAARAYVERLVELSHGLGPRPDASDADLEPFRTEVMPHVDAIVRVVAGAQALRRRGLGARRRAAIEALGGSVDWLALLGQQRDEVTHTRLLAAFLDARGGGSPAAGACAARFEALLRRKHPALGELGLDDGHAQAERILGEGGRVDVAIESDRAVVFVEAKIDAEERAFQLDDYARALDSPTLGARTRVLVFLTARDDHRSRSEVPHVRITFRELLLAWLPVATDGAASCDALRQYLKAVAVLVGVAAAGPFDMWPLGVQRACLELFEKEELAS